MVWICKTEGRNTHTEKEITGANVGTRRSGKTSVEKRHGSRGFAGRRNNTGCDVKGKKHVYFHIRSWHKFGKKYILLAVRWEKYNSFEMGNT